jgi:hypothetical protein
VTTLRNFASVHCFVGATRPFAQPFSYFGRRLNPAAEPESVRSAQDSGEPLSQAAERLPAICGSTSANLPIMSLTSTEVKKRKVRCRHGVANYVAVKKHTIPFVFGRNRLKTADVYPGPMTWWLRERSFFNSSSCLFHRVPSMFRLREYFDGAALPIRSANIA